jgi:hypothetical protein
MATETDKRLTDSSAAARNFRGFSQPGLIVIFMARHMPDAELVILPQVRKCQQHKYWAQT